MSRENSVNKAKITGCYFLTAMAPYASQLQPESAVSSLYNHSSNSLTYKAIKQYKSTVFFQSNKLLDPIKSKINYKLQEIKELAVGTVRVTATTKFYRPKIHGIQVYDKDFSTVITCVTYLVCFFLVWML